MTPPVETSWHLITAWLADHAPTTAAMLSPPASEDDIRNLGREVPGGLPDELIAWWRLGDGVGRPDGAGYFLPPRFAPMPVREALGVRRLMAGLVSPDAYRIAAADEAGSRSGAFLDTFVPIAADGGGDHLVVDLRPGAWHGCIQEWRNDDGCQTGPLWSGVAEMLAEVADDFHHHTGVLAAHAERARAQGFRKSPYTAHANDGTVVWLRVT
ncbi:MAG: SMI1/KNR4 family protein [Saccharothrix sp.]|nr:SMI1/KNR4 family protein [Saccharothrix sp.]